MTPRLHWSPELLEMSVNNCLYSSVEMEPAEEVVRKIRNFEKQVTAEGDGDHGGGDEPHLSGSTEILTGCAAPATAGARRFLGAHQRATS